MPIFYDEWHAQFEVSLHGTVFRIENDRSGCVGSMGVFIQLQKFQRKAVDSQLGAP